MEIVLTNHVTFNVYKTYLKLHYFKRNSITLFWLMATFITGLVLFLTHFIKFGFTVFIFAHTYYFCMSIVLILIPFVFYAYTMKSIKDKFIKGSLSHSAQFVLTDTHFVITNYKGNSYTTRWENIHSVDEADGFFMIFLDDITVQILVKNQMENLQIKAVSDLLKEIKLWKSAS